MVLNMFHHNYLRPCFYCHAFVRDFVGDGRSRRSVKAPDGKTHYLPCSPGEPGATAATLATLAENGLAENVRPVSLGPKVPASGSPKVLMSVDVCSSCS